MYKIIIKVSILLIVGFLVLNKPVVYAACPPDCTTVEDVTNNSTQSVSLTNPLGDVTVPGLIARVITAVLGIVGSLALVMFIYGGFTWMLAAGNNEKIKKGKDILVWSAIGLVVIFSSYAVVKYLITTIGSS